MKDCEVTEEGVKIPGCEKAIHSDDRTFAGGRYSASLRIVGGDRRKEVTTNLPGTTVSKASINHMDNFLKAAA